MKKTLLVLATAGLVTGCVKVQLLPEDAIKNTWKAGKDAYDESKLKRNGGEKRALSNQVLVAEYETREAANTDCINMLKTRLNNESLSRKAVVTSERIIVADGLSNKVVECQVVGFVWP